MLPCLCLSDLGETDTTRAVQTLGEKQGSTVLLKVKAPFPQPKGLSDHQVPAWGHLQLLCSVCVLNPWFLMSCFLQILGITTFIAGFSKNEKMAKT